MNELNCIFHQNIGKAISCEQPIIALDSFLPKSSASPSFVSSLVLFTLSPMAIINLFPRRSTLPPEPRVFTFNHGMTRHLYCLNCKWMWSYIFYILSQIEKRMRSYVLYIVSIDLYSLYSLNGPDLTKLLLPVIQSPLKVTSGSETFQVWFFMEDLQFTTLIIININVDVAAINKFLKFMIIINNNLPDEQTRFGAIRRDEKIVVFIGQYRITLAISKKMYGENLPSYWFCRWLDINSSLAVKRWYIRC